MMPKGAIIPHLTARSLRMMNLAVARAGYCPGFQRILKPHGISPFRSMEFHLSKGKLPISTEREQNLTTMQQADWLAKCRIHGLVLQRSFIPTQVPDSARR